MVYVCEYVYRIGISTDVAISLNTTPCIDPVHLLCQLSNARAVIGIVSFALATVYYLIRNTASDLI